MTKSTSEQYYIAMNNMHDDGSENHPAAQLRRMARESRSPVQEQELTPRQLVMKMVKEFDTIAEGLSEELFLLVVASSGAVSPMVKHRGLHKLSKEEIRRKRDTTLHNAVAKMQMKIQELDNYVETHNHFDLLRGDSK